MGEVKKMRGKRAIAFCAPLLLFFAMAFSQAVKAVSASIVVTLTLEQVFTSPAESSALDVFVYRLVAVEGGNPMPAGASDGEYLFSVKGTDVVSGTIPYSGAGVYHYTIEQVVCCAETGYTYDMEVYTLTVYIKNVDLGLEEEVIITKSSGQKTDKVSYSNSYAPLPTDPTLMGEPLIEKVVLGSPPAAATFTFELRAADKAQPMPSGSTNGVKTIAIAGGGKAGIGTWRYTEAGIYVYTVAEVNAAEAGYAYDDEIYTITDSVVDTAGQLVLTRRMTNASGGVVSAFTFTNSYSATGGAKAGSPQTGDDSALWMHRAALIISGVVLAGCVVYLAMAARRGKKQP